MIMILDGEPHWLNAGVIDWHTQDFFALFSAENDGSDSNPAITLGSGLWEGIEINSGLGSADRTS